ncbi:lysophospholipid acyltransferase family protein [Spirochaeta dissipatitropha]
MKFLISLIVSSFVWLFCILIAIPLFIIACLLLAVSYPFDRQKKLLHQYSCLWASIYTWINPFWKIRISGRENIRRGETYMIVSNHQSLVDILVLYRLFKHFKWVAKKELFSIPVFGWHMRLNSYISLNRSDRRSQFEMLKTAIKTLKNGSSVVIFPEGTRTPDGNIQEFKEGAFVIAKKAGVPIIPVVIDGSYTSMPKKSFIMRKRTHIQVRVLPEISREAVAEMDTSELSQKSFELIKANLPS